MTRNPDLSAINCTSCGAGLDVLGGGRVVVHICPYCGTELDALDNYKALRSFADLPRPDSPFSIGMAGMVQGVEFTIIGTLAFEERWHAKISRWVDHQLYSPTHGYAWLTYEDNHCTFSRRYRKPGWISTRQVETMESPPSVLLEGQTFTYYDTTVGTVTFAEGEFTWAPRVGDASTTVNAMSQTAMLGFSETGGERETYRTVYLPKQEIEAAFGVTLPKPLTTHPLQPFRKSANADFLTKASGLFAAVAAVIGLVFMTMGGERVLPVTRFGPQDLPIEIPLDVTGNGGLGQIDFTSNASNSWAFLDITLYDPEDVPLFEAGRTLERYSGYDEGRWSEGSGSASLRFFAETPGTHTLSLEMSEAGTWSGGDRPSAISQMTVSARVGMSSGFWPLALAFGFLLIAAVPMLRKMLHNHLRWRGSDWSDDD